EYLVPLFDRGKGRERDTNLGNDTGDDELFLTGRLHRRDKVVVVPGVDLPWPGDVGGIREQFLKFRHERSVRAVLETGGQDRRQLEIFRSVRQGQHIVLE